ncbi:GNAT family N-acetyltransferase [Cognatiluteimonas profundi]|uniref:GNAT family N-acetyltransferase n=1 Tax=Cognatiluteimonas profundi TaxID=2594501 RepID=UPI00131DC92E|nr:GNAT family N-acetyltransferase [Lysobacter profundi]
MAARNRLPPWHEMQHLSNGRDVLIRPIRPDDAQPLRAAFPLLEPDEVRVRMQSSLPELSAEMADKLSRPDPRSEFAIVVTEPLPPGEAMVGAVARATIVPGGRDVEFAILVSRFIGGMGLGRHLMRRLVRWARGKQVDRIYGDVLAQNQPMLSLAQSLGFHSEASSEPGMVRVVLDLQPAKG